MEIFLSRYVREKITKTYFEYVIKKKFQYGKR